MNWLHCCPVVSVGSGNWFALFPFQKVPSENQPIRISIHLYNHFMKLNKGKPSSAVEGEWKEHVLLGRFHCCTVWIITVTLIDLPPLFLLSTVTSAMSTMAPRKEMPETSCKSYHFSVNFCVAPILNLKVKHLLQKTHTHTHKHTQTLRCVCRKNKGKIKPQMLHWLESSILAPPLSVLQRNCKIIKKKIHVFNTKGFR